MSDVKRCLAVLEVTIVTALTWGAYKALKLVEPGEFNCSPGLAMLLAALLLSLLHWREFPSYGIITPTWRSGLNLGVALSLLLLLGGTVHYVFFPSAAFTVAVMPIDIALITAAVEVVAYVAVFFLLMRVTWRPLLARVPLLCTLSILVALILAAPAYAVYRDAPLSRVAGVAGSLLFFTAVGEEVFFRGYVQSRLNGVFGRRRRFLGASLGPGMLISALLFGLIHIFNPTKPYEGHWELSWLWGGSAFLGGLLYGYLRELTGNVWTAAIVHALGGEYRGLWQIFLAKR